MNNPSVPALVQIPAGTLTVHAILEIPRGARSIVVFAHGLDSNHMSPRNRLVGRSLLQRGFAILQPNLTSLPGHDADHDNPPSVHGIALRLVAIIDWLASNPATRGLNIGLFGARSGAAATLIAAAMRPHHVHAIVSRGGRLELSDELLAAVQAPTLMLVGSHDKSVLDHNRQTCEKMRRKPMLELIHGASHLFGEPGKLEQVATLSSLWFQQTLARCS